MLVTGFEPFGGEKVNPSELVARSLDGRLIAGRPISVAILPVETRSLHDRLELLRLEEEPEIVLLLGQAGGRSALALERVAVNVLDFDIPDNVGVLRKNEPIVRGGPDARLSNLPFEKIVAAWAEIGVPGYVSNSAGTFICNQSLYELLALTETATPPVLVGLVHLPFLPAQAIAAGPETHPSMTFELMKKGVEQIIDCIVPWVENRGAESAAQPRERTSRMWIPRGVKEAER